MTARLSILVVSYNTRTLTLECLQSIKDATAGVDYEVVVVDNASADGSAEAIRSAFSDFRLIALDENVGFARANNIAAEEAVGEQLLLLNPDTVVMDGAISSLLGFAAKHPEAKIYGGRTLFPDGRLNRSSCWGRPTLWSMLCAGSGLSTVFENSRLFDPTAYGDWNRDSVREVDIVTGCFLLISASLWRNLGGFDERFFMYGEEVDLCFRAASLGARPMICPDATIIHYGGQSDKVRSDKMTMLFRAKALLCREHWRSWSAWLGVRTLDLWALSRLIAYGVGGIVRPGLREQGRQWRSVWRARRRWWTAGRESESSSPKLVPGLTARSG